MQAYEISRNESTPPQYVGDLAAARRLARTIPGAARVEVRVSLLDFPHNKDAILTLLNGKSLSGTPKRRWRLGSRGGSLVEVAIDDI